MDMENPRGRCVSCGFLAKRAKRQGYGRPHAGYHEVEQVDRENPLASFDFVPGDTNAVQKGELACYRNAADLPSEIRNDQAAREAIRKHRSCIRWKTYEPGLS